MSEFSRGTAKTETYEQAATNHGEADNPDHEVGDLQQMFRVAYNMLSRKQRIAFHNHEDVQAVLEAGEACLSCSAVPGTSEYGTVGDGFDGYCPSCADRREEKR